jgi:hypothetical protein
MTRPRRRATLKPLRGKEAASPDKKESAMQLTKSRVLVSALSVAGIVGAVALGLGSSYVGETLQRPVVQSATEPAPAETAVPASDKPAAAPAEKAVRVEAPSTRVDIDKQSGKVRVDAPHTEVRVDPDQGRVRVRAPYVNLDIRW